MRKSRGFRQTGACLATSIRRATEKRGFTETRLLTDWAAICGPELAAVVSPVKVTYSKDGFGATLVVQAPGACAPEISMQRDVIRDRVNACYGYNAIQRVSIRQTGAPTSGFREEKASFGHAPGKRKMPAQTLSALEPIGDEGLRKALNQLGENVSGRSAANTSHMRKS